MWAFASPIFLTPCLTFPLVSPFCTRVQTSQDPLCMSFNSIEITEGCEQSYFLLNVTTGISWSHWSSMIKSQHAQPSRYLWMYSWILQLLNCYSFKKKPPFLCVPGRQQKNAGGRKRNMWSVWKIVLQSLKIRTRHWLKNWRLSKTYTVTNQNRSAVNAS